MKRFWSITLNILIWAAIIAYLVFATRHCRSEQKEGKVNSVVINVVDYHRLQIISPATIREWLEEEGIELEGAALEDINTELIINVIRSHPFISSVTAYKELSGTLNISVSQREPIMRISRGDGNDFYISEDNWILPVKTGQAEYVPVASGEFGLPFENGWFGELVEPIEAEQKKLHQNYTFLVKLINFVKLVNDDTFGSDTFGSDTFVQINVQDKIGSPDWKEPEVELIPRAGSHIIIMGTLDDAEQKLSKLALFYRNVLNYEGWDTYRQIDISNKDQVVCRK